ncbi:MAG TPA: HAD-IC family P-type ATPase [Nitrospiria bacterium]|nr:HAD-IC family P-type ATPase [Nitrospiria bacterium]
MVQTVHTAAKGRTRFKVSGLYRSEALKRRLESSLSTIEGISRVSASILTGNVLVVFNSGATPSQIASLIIEIASDPQHESRPHPPRPSPDPSRETVVSTSPIKDSLSAVGKRLADLLPYPKEMEAQPWHLIESDRVVFSLKTSRSSGLTEEAAGDYLRQFGPNLLPESVPRSSFGMFIDQFKSLPNLLLGAAAGLSIATGGVSDAVIILGVVLINAAIGYVTESQAEKTIQSLKGLVRPSATVIRNGKSREIRAESIVTGDILVLKPGSYIAADARLLETQQMYVDESALTGESVPVLKTSAPMTVENLPLGDRLNMVYMGTLVTGGQAMAVVVATGRHTEMGRIQILLGEAESPETPMERQLGQMSNRLVLISTAVCGLVFGIGLLRGQGLLHMLKTAISLAVAAVPEGLPTVATTTLALGIRNMRRHHILIRHLEAVETLGAVQTICLDKTGTITLNRMSVVAIHAGEKRISVSDGRFRCGEELLNPFASDELLRLIHVSVLCNESAVVFQEGKHTLRGSPTENALLQMAISSGVDVLKLRDRYPVLQMNHRSENRNFMSTLHVSADTEATGPLHLLAVKGNPIEVLMMCRYRMSDGQIIPLTDEDRSKIQTENEGLSGQALRVLGVAYGLLHPEEDGSDRGLIWLGHIGMADPVRHGVKELIRDFHRAGIETIMITGDQSPTAYAIGKELSLSGDKPLSILDSTHLSELAPEAMIGLSKQVHVFARVSPSHKLQIVQALQKAGKVVAMTGDGINDGPALKAADIGIAMGHTGTDVAREVADVIVEDDNLETMIVAVSHGRTIYNNIRKSVHFLLATNLSEIIVVFGAISAGLGEPLNSMQLLWINLISDVFPALGLAMEPPEPDVLSRPPRNPEEPIVQLSDFKRIASEAAVLSAGTLGAYGYGILRYGPGPKAGTLAFTTLTLGQLLHALSCRSENHSLLDPVRSPQNPPLQPNPYLSLAVTGSVALQVLTLAVPGLRRLLGVTPVGLLDGVVIGGAAVVPLVVNELTKGRSIAPALPEPEKTRGNP